MVRMEKKEGYFVLTKTIPTIVSSKLITHTKMKFITQTTLTVLISFNGFQFTKRPSTKKQHRRTRLATYKNKPIAIGGFDPDGDSHNEVEQLNFDGGWSEVEEYPFSMRL